MQKSSGLQPLCLNHVTKQEDIWSSDSDSGITVGSHSPPSKTTPDSGIGSEHLSWNLPPPPPSLLADDAHFPAMEQRDVTPPAGRSVLSPDEEERQRKQDYVRNTLLEYERQKRLSEERDNVTYNNDVINYKSDVSSNRRSQHYADHARPEDVLHTDIDFNINSRFSHHTDRHSADSSNSDGRFESFGNNSRRSLPSNYRPSQNITSARERQCVAAMAQGKDPYTGLFPEPPRLHFKEDGESERGGFLTEDLLASPPGDDGYGTDSRSFTTASLSSPLSSSLSSLTTDSSSSLNGSQRATGGNNGVGSARAQPVQSSGRLVMAKRGMLVKRRDLPPVERVESVTLEDRLRALTTIEEEDPGSSLANPGAPAVTSALVSGTRSGVSGSTSGGVSGTKSGAGDTRTTAENIRVSSRRPAGGSAVYEDTSRDYESLYTVIKKKKHRPDQPGLALADARHRQHRDNGGERLPSQVPPSSHRPAQGPSERGGRQSPLYPSDRQHSAASDNPASPRTEEGFHRAVPVCVGPGGNTFYARGVADVRNTGAVGDEGCSTALGHGGVKVNDSGEVEIDYSYYMKATPSESNDELNTYSPTLPREGSGHLGNGPPSFAGQVDNYPSDRFPDGGVVRQDGRREDHDPRDFSVTRGRLGSQGDGRGFADYHDNGRPDPDGRPRVQFSVQPDQLVMRVQPLDSGLRQGGVMCSMPNLSMHGPSVSRRHENTIAYDAPRNYDASKNTADSVSRNGAQDVLRRDPHEPAKQTQDSVPVTRRNPPPGSGYPAGVRRPGQGERNSCDVGSLYRQTAGTVYTTGGCMPKGVNPPLPGGVASDRMSLNLGDLPRIQEQLRATSEMLLSSAPKRHQFASSSDIYKLFQGQRGEPDTGFPQGRNPPHRHSFHTFAGANPAQNLTDVKSRLRPNVVSPTGRSEQLHGSSVSGLTSGLPGQGPVRGNHNISVPDHAVYANVGHHRDGELFDGAVHVPRRSSSASSMDSDLSLLTDTLAKGQQFMTDIVLDEDGERLSTLV